MPPKTASRRGAGTGARQTASSTTRPQPQSQPGPGTNSGSQNATSRPTPTPTPTPGPSNRPGVQRLQSLKKPTPTGSITPSARATPTSAPRPTPRPTPASGAASASNPPTKGEPAKPALKYAPRAVGRRSKEERENIERREAERHRERLAEAAEKQRGQGRGRGRGRGGGRGATFRGRGGPAGRGLGRGGDSRQTSVSNSRRSATRSVIDRGSREVENEGFSSDDSDADLRVSIDQINIEGDEDLDLDMDEGVGDGKGKKKMAAGKGGATEREKGLRPIRVERHEHEERVVSVNMESSSKKSAEMRDQAKEPHDEALFVDEELPKEAGEGEGDGQPRVKPEPREDDETMMDAIPQANDDSMVTDDGLPEQPARVRERLSEEKQEQEKKATKDPKALLRTKEDIEEYDRHAQDLEAVKDLLIAEPTTTAGEGEGEGEERPADAEKAAEEEANKDKLSGQLFLMQFPPMTPNLVANGEKPAAAAADENTPQEAQESAQAQPTVKREDDQEAQPQPQPQLQAAEGEEYPAPKIVTATDWQLPAGRVGKLNVHASGRVTMDWGGIMMEVDRATAVEFLQEALIVSGEGEGEAAAEDEFEEDKKVWAMGQLSGKFTVTPDWERML